jgi:hypothetical protein
VQHRTTISWVDIGVRERLTILASHDGALATAALLALLSNATMSTISEGAIVATGALAPSEDTHCDLSDTWILSAEDPGSNPIQLYIPAAEIAYAQADQLNYVQLSTQWLQIATTVVNVAVPYTGDDVLQLNAAMIARGAEGIYQPWYIMSSSIDWARRTILWYGTHGRSRLTHLQGPVARLGAQFDALMSALQNVSAASATHYWEGTMAHSDETPSTDMYNSVEDACHVWFQDDAGNITEVTIPAPSTVIFLPDGKTLDLAQTNVAAFVASAVAELSVPTSGLPVTSCIGGHLSKRSVY